MGSNFAARIWIYAKEVLTRGQIPTLEMEAYLIKETLDVHYAVHELCSCGYFRWPRVGVRNHSCPACGRSDGHGTGLQNRYSLCGTMVHVKVFSTYTIESSIGKREIKIKKYYEALNMAIMYAISRPFGGKHTPRSSMLASVAKVLHKTSRKWGVNKEMEGWVMRGSLELLLYVDDDDSDE